MLPGTHLREEGWDVQQVSSYCHITDSQLLALQEGLLSKDLI
jgi:hypothetical protein